MKDLRAGDPCGTLKKDNLVWIKTGLHFRSTKNWHKTKIHGGSASALFCDYVSTRLYEPDAYIMTQPLFT